MIEIDTTDKRISLAIENCPTIIGLKWRSMELVVGFVIVWFAIWK
jgi:hypothetical protein